jgi:hypothetical protein
MKLLQPYSKNGYDFTVIQRSDQVAICHGKSKTSPAETWEVFLIQHHNGLTIAGNHVPPAEYPPSNEQWGSKGWTFTTEDAAWEKFQKLIFDDSVAG